MTPELAEKFLSKLDKIIELLEFKNSIVRARVQMRRGTIYFDDSEVFPDANLPCTCEGHKPGECTGGWYRPVHGQQFQ